MAKRDWMIATLLDEADMIAREYGLGLEIDEFCTAVNMDENFEHWNRIVLDRLKYAEARVFHAPFAELYPCAIDPLVREVAMKRFSQAADLAARYGIRRMVVHGGFVPHIYFPVWYEERSSVFWREFLKTRPENFELLIENVMEEDPDSFMRMFDAIGDDRAGICLDVGHANVVSPVSPEDWIAILGNRIRHVHLHNNMGEHDTHDMPYEGCIDTDRILELLDHFAPGASITLECLRLDGASIERLPIRKT